MMGGLDSLLSIVQMPSGIPVATVGVNGGENAGLLALQILGVKYPDIAEKLQVYKDGMRRRSTRTTGRFKNPCKAPKNPLCAGRRRKKFFSGDKIMEKKEQLYEGKAKKVYATDDPDLVIVSYKDDATAFKRPEKGHDRGQGRHQQPHEQHDVPAHGEEGHPHPLRGGAVRAGDARQEGADRPRSKSSSATRRRGACPSAWGSPKAPNCPCTFLEFSYKNDELGDPLINNYHALAMGLATKEEIGTIENMAFAINDIMIEFLQDAQHRPHRLQAGIRPLQGRHRAGGRNFPRHLPFLGHDDGREAGQRQIPPGTWAAVEDAYKEVFKRLTEAK